MLTSNPGPTSHIPWVEKHRPATLTKLKQNDNILNFFKNCVLHQDMPHLLLYGPPGTGKTSAVLAMCKEMFGTFAPDRVTEFNASDDRGIAAVRELISKEAKKYTTVQTLPDGRSIPSFKVIILDEADSMTEEAQDALRVIIEQYSTVTRFCFICNYINKMTDAVKSRCSVMYFKKLEVDAMESKLKEIAETESMTLSNKVLNTIIEVSSGDMRKAIGYLQNVAYVYAYKKLAHKKFTDMTPAEQEFVLSDYATTPVSKDVTEDDIYKIAAMLSKTQVKTIYDKASNCKSVLEIMTLTKETMKTGYPIDVIIEQINNHILSNDSIPDLTKAKILSKSGLNLFKLKESANEQIQLLQYFSNIFAVTN
jgi:replication factor C subunit 2/4